MRLKSQVKAVMLIVTLLVILGTTFQALAQSELPYVENGILYHSTTENETLKQGVVPGVLRIIDHKPELNTLLYLASPRAKYSDGGSGSDLMLVNTIDWSVRPIAANVVTANLSPDGTKVALWTKNHEVHIVSSDGTFMQKVGIHGAAPIFSHNGKLLAYKKLADTSPDGDLQGFFELAKGIAIYDLQTGRERLVTTGGEDDFAPVGFSRDMTKLYFNSSRPLPADSRIHVASLWMVDLLSGRTQRLTNLDMNDVKNHILVPVVNESALWTSDRATIVSSNGPREGVWRFVFSENGNLLSATHIGDGDSPQWQVPDKSIAFRRTTGHWQTLNIR